MNAPSSAYDDGWFGSGDAEAAAGPCGAPGTADGANAADAGDPSADDEYPRSVVSDSH